MQVISLGSIFEALKDVKGVRKAAAKFSWGKVGGSLVVRNIAPYGKEAARFRPRVGDG
jgi:hypothetical protein